MYWFNILYLFIFFIYHINNLIGLCFVINCHYGLIYINYFYIYWVNVLYLFIFFMYYINNLISLCFVVKYHLQFFYFKLINHNPIIIIIHPIQLQFFLYLKYYFLFFYYFFSIYCT